MIVVDASVATKWRLAEPDSGRALAILEKWQDRLCGPDLLAIEVCRALVTAANARRIERQAAHDASAEWLESIDRGDVVLYRLTPRQIAAAVEIALDVGHPLADCLYLALALDLNAELVTCDAKFAAKARTKYPTIKLLADYGD